MPPNLVSRRRIVATLLICALGLVALSLRLGFLTIARGDQLGQTGLSARLRSVPVQAARGDILDAQGRVLARSATSFSVFAIPAQVEHPELEARELAPLLDMSVSQILPKLQRRIAFAWLRRRLDDTNAKAIRALALPGIDLAPETRRIYPYGSVAAHVLGFSGIDNQGLDGVEMVYDRVLRGKSGSIALEMDARNRVIPHAKEVYTPPVQGDTIQLTLNVDVERLAERAAATAMQDTGAKAVEVAIENVRTGGIVALVNRPSYDPNAYAKAPQQNRRDQMVSDVIPPGSTFKAVTAATALDLGVVTPNSGFYDPGFIRVNGVPLHCWRKSGHGALSFRQVVENSCNVGFVEVGLRIGVKRFYAYLKRFHLIGRSGIDLPGEASSIVPPQAKVKPVDLATMSFGQTLAITPINLLAAVSAIANDGVWERPHLMDRVISPQGKVLQTYPDKGQRVVSAQTAKDLQVIMSGVILRGSGKKAAVPGYVLAGKTGTAQAVINGRYVEGKYIASFIGYGPLPHPEFAMVVEIVEPAGAYYGGQIAAPVFGRVMAQLFQHQGLTPTLRLPPDVVVPNLVGRSLTDAAALVQKAKLTVRMLGAGTKVLSQLPPAGIPVQRGTQILAFTAGGYAVVPNVVGMTVDQAAQALDPVGLRLVVEGEGVVVRQEPAAGTRVPVGGSVVVEAQLPHGQTASGQD